MTLGMTPEKARSAQRSVLVTHLGREPTEALTEGTS